MGTKGLTTRFFFTSLGVALSVSAQAQAGKAPPLPQPPPYGAYFLDQFRQNRDEHKAALDAIARHYGYKDEHDAYRACLRARTTPDCAGDVVAHRRHESPETTKYGFKTWREARSACIKNSKGDRQFGPVNYCSADPFLKLRSGK